MFAATVQMVGGDAQKKCNTCVYDMATSGVLGLLCCLAF